MRIIGSDYDGTLTYGIGEATFKAISAWRKAGNLFGIVSGRPASFLKDVLMRYPKLELDFFVGFNGAVITDGCGHLIFERRCEDVQAAELAELLLSWNCPFVHVNSNAYYCVISDEAERPSWADPGDVFTLDQLPSLPYFHQISTQLPDNESKAAQITERLRQIYAGRLNPLQNATCIDVPHVSVNKTQGLLRVAEHFGVGKDDLIAVGDNINDTDMIRDLYSYAMANGVDSVKLLANRITSHIADLIAREMNQ